MPIPLPDKSGSTLSTTFMDLTLTKKEHTYTAVAKPAPQTVRNSETHATVQGMDVELDALALKMDKGMMLLERLRAENSPRYAEVRARFDGIKQAWEKLFEDYDALLGESHFGCIECRVKSGEQIDWSRVPSNARLCSRHARNFMAQRARVRWPQTAPHRTR